MPEVNPGSEHFAVYSEYSKTLRTWLVAYGIGAPVLLLTNERLASILTKSPDASVVAAMFLAGVALQVGLSFINKTIAWVCYWAALHAESRPETARWKRVVICQRVSEWYWIDLMIDVASSVLFLWATWKAFSIVFPNTA